ncbi:uncharacterized protein LOC131428598 [Malaya genurostris]|uniref:uncharacterized protein LOC131428598 n=1 Tax=Malaya genurostris TaxID=325434 RepID=UPI0026F3F8F2|nr:uncharacterized protein LOC131428598 [Malaya genurostris]
MEKFWIIEDDASPAYSIQETLCENHFRDTVSRDIDGRYCVRLPLKCEELSKLGDNKQTAFHRFRLIERRLGRDARLASQYREFMEEYIRLGHMKRISPVQAETKPSFFLPHHPVIREASSTTKLRVVFDASCKSETGLSLNDVMLVGPIIQEDLRSIIMRSRIHPIMLVADVAKMFRQVRLHEEDTPLQRIFWRSSPAESIEIYELKTVTYGTAAAPYLATRVLQQLAKDEQLKYPIAAKATCEDFYVDDFLSGGKNVEEAIELRTQMEAMFGSAGLQLRKWASNSLGALEGIPEDNRALKQTVEFSQDQTIKSLGLHWEPQADCLKYYFETPCFDSSTAITKRTTLSCIAKLFDPLGLVSPVIVIAKIFMQALWSLKNENNASELAYGSCAYIRSMNAAGEIKIALLTSRSRVAPIKQQSIPRLELCGALLSAELYEKISKSLRTTVRTYFWVDSTTVLSWLKSPPSTWSTFVANRVSKIQHATQNCEWNHVAGAENPADIVSRGLPADDILKCELWWQGSPWLKKHKEFWPVQIFERVDSSDTMNEARRSMLAATSLSVSFIEEYTSRFSDYQRLLRTTAYCQRFAKNLRSEKKERMFSTLTTSEIRDAELTLVRLVQRDSFPAEWKSLQETQTVASNSRLRWFHPIIGTDNVIRIGGRLDRATVSFDSKHQILLPGSHQFSKLLICCYHQRLLHAAVQLLTNTIRLRFWILGGRSVVRRIIHACVTCFRAKPKLVEQFMSELPSSRVTASRPFSTVGIDFWGPIHLKPRHRRDAPPKAYVAVFVCFSTKAAHLELVVDLTTVKFLQAFRRFVSRRGLCSDVWTDNGRNFVGAANDIRRLIRAKEFKHSMARECSDCGIRWHFNPPRGSHFGGLWEAAINSAQKHFVRVLGDRKLDFDDMETLLTQIECCLNSRPLTKLYEDPSDLQALTPGHFLIGTALNSVPDNNYDSIPFNRLHQWQQIQKILQDIWKRWHVEYLATLQPRTKWYKPPVKLQTDQLVIILEENLPPMRWPMARVRELHPVNYDGFCEADQHFDVSEERINIASTYNHTSFNGNRLNVQGPPNIESTRDELQEGHSPR